ncbi:hypothetical protein [uncultured Vagococcus sp.]|nr:hypothetical protein [uncultured Vagococcus sp.]
MENKIIVIKDSVQKSYELPAYGEVVLQVVEGKVMFVSTTNKEKI